MTIEKATQRNLYSVFGSGKEFAMMREGKVRAQGPFRHPILAGCAGATALPFALYTYGYLSRLQGVAGIASCLMVVFACSSSGPLAAFAVSLFAAFFWPHRIHLKKLLWFSVFFGLAYWVIKGRGPWFLMASIDLVGGSTGWHRAQLIDQGFNYLDEWWLWGTDYTRHWMATGVSWSPDHVDMTNYFLHLGTMVGLLPILLLMYLIGLAFRNGLACVKAVYPVSRGDAFLVWCGLGALAAHVISFASISYFDQMYALFFLLLASLLTIRSTDATTGSESA
ncbi:MAG: hypothetical protein SFV32_11850 [Opitutaceae bacterium]|nr:hypothetical protein [Opitutaceae bacterium]